MPVCNGILELFFSAKKVNMSYISCRFFLEKAMESSSSFAREKSEALLREVYIALLIKNNNSSSENQMFVMYIEIHGLSCPPSPQERFKHCSSCCVV